MHRPPEKSCIGCAQDPGRTSINLPRAVHVDLNGCEVERSIDKCHAFTLRGDGWRQHALSAACAPNENPAEYILKVLEARVTQDCIEVVCKAVGGSLGERED